MSRGVSIKRWGIRHLISKTYLSPIWGFFTCWLRNNPRHSFTFLQLTYQCLLVKIYLLRTGFFCTNTVAFPPPGLLHYVSQKCSTLFSLKAWAPPITIRKSFFSSLHQVMCPLCAVCLQGWDLFTNISAQDFCFSNRAPHCACKLRLRGGELFTFFLKNVQRARSCARCASLGETAPAKRLLVVHAKSTTVVVRPTGGRWHYPANHLQPNHLHQHQHQHFIYILHDITTSSANVKSCRYFNSPLTSDKFYLCLLTLQKYRYKVIPKSVFSLPS